MKGLIFVLSFLIISVTSKSQENQELLATIVRMDSIFFKAFNECDTTSTKRMFTTDLEFYHDNGGLTGYEQNVSSIRHRCTQEYTVRRELVSGSTEVFPVKDFGAIQLGSHRFYYTLKGGKETLDGTFRFVHVWKNENGAWKISRVISFDH